MFESVTKRRKNPIVNIFGWSLLTIVCVIFIFIGFSPSSNLLGSGGAAAEVNGDAISLREYKELVDRLGENKGAGTDRESRRKMQENAINILVSRSLIVQEAKRLNIFVSDKEVAQALMDIQPFYEDGVFSRLRYKTYLQQARLTESEFENRIRRDLLIQKMSQLIGFTAKDISLMDDFDKKVDQAKINVSYFSVSPQVLAGKAKLSGAELEEFLKKNQAKVEEYFKKNKSDYQKKEQVKARHILVKSKDDKAESMKEALEKMNKIISETTVANFSEMAKKYSEDPGSKARGGDLGFFPKGRMVPEFENAAFTGKVGEISKPVQTKYGYHIILVDEKQSPEEVSLDEVKTKVANIVYSEGFYETVLSEMRGKIENKDYDGLNAIVEKHQLKWKDTGFFSITKENIPGIGSNKPFLDEAMTLSQESPYSTRFVRSGDTSYFIKYKDAKIDKSQKANAQMDFFKQFMKQQKMNMAVQTWTDSLRKKASVKINSDLFR